MIDLVGGFWIVLALVSIYLSYYLGYSNGYKAGEAPWIWSHRSAIQDPNHKATEET